jgi:hypothetical protein
MATIVDLVASCTALNSLELELTSASLCSESVNGESTIIIKTAEEILDKFQLKDVFGCTSLRRLRLGGRKAPRASSIIRYWHPFSR